MQTRRLYFIALAALAFLAAGCQAPTDDPLPEINKDYSSTNVGTLKYVGGGTITINGTDMTVSDFRIGQYEITGAQYSDVMGVPDPSFHGSVFKNPVESVTWYDAVEFCNRLSALEGLAPVYMIYWRVPESGFPITSATVNIDWNANGYRLPTEMEWRFAASGGNKSRGYAYAGSNNIDDVAWYSGNSDSITHSVGGKAANELGLFDMNGNVHEWCWDFYADLPTVSQIDYRGPPSGTNRCLRGGTYLTNSVYCTVSSRFASAPSGQDASIGIRVVRK